MLTRTKAQFRAQYRQLEREAAGRVRPKDPNKPLTLAQLRALYAKPGKLLAQIELVQAELAKGERPGLKVKLRRSRILKEEYLEAQTKLAIAYNDPRYKKWLFKIRLEDASR